MKEQVVSMEVNFLLWRTKIHNDQMTQQEEFLQERLVKQDRVSCPLLFFIFLFVNMNTNSKY